MSALESVSLADSVPGWGWDAAEPLELMNLADEWIALTDSHSVPPPPFLLSCEFRPPTMEEGGPAGGALFCWVISEMMLPVTESLS